MFYSREHGIFAKGAITGQYNDYKYKNIDDLHFVESNPSQYLLYDHYINDREIYGGTMFFYKTQPGGHAMLYSFL